MLVIAWKYLPINSPSASVNLAAHPFSPKSSLYRAMGWPAGCPYTWPNAWGFCAQIHFPFPAAFVWELFHRLLSSVPETSPFAPDVLAWRIMALLEELEDIPQFAPLHAYCQDGNDFTRFALASKIADVFDQYLVYRPDWILQWERGEDEHWQAELWRRLAPTTRSIACNCTRNC